MASRQEVQGDLVKDEAAAPAIHTPIPRNEANRLGVRLFQRGFKRHSSTEKPGGLGEVGMPPEDGGITFV